ncbi:phage shock protein C (PspC) family protein [Labedaea rhizosphaerae]|uniref:Phage shock protein C (PspC) family protein n=1 Tax=Labedaea rhizosphaerae TaxID=598644 RepID=A0A4R6SNX4_LABRH|nr:phage shock protein C (PspC) family protein [Labedaea rhizosphaerae]
MCVRAGHCILVDVSAQQTQTGGPTPPNVEDTVKDFWATRPRRPRDGRKIAGVAAGIGNRYGIDPVIVRVAFVVAAIYGGAGIFLYLVGWLLLPEERDEVSPFESVINKGRSSTSTVFTVLLCLALIPLSSWVFDGPFSGLLGVAIILGLLFLLHRSKGHLNRPDDAQPYGAQPFAAAQPTTENFATEPGDQTVRTAEPETEPDSPPAWDPLGAAPFAWDLPEPGPGPSQESEPTVQRARRSRVGLMTVGVAFVVGAACVALSGTFDWLTPPHIAGLLLAVLGLGMVGGAFAGGGRGLLGLAVPLAAIGVLYTSVSTGDGGFHGVGDRTETPRSIAQVAPSYSRSVGSIDLDLTELPDTGRSVHTSVDANVGSATVRVPANADVEVHCRAKIGSVDCLGQRQDGTGVEVKIDNDLGDDGEGGLKIVLDVRVGTGDVEVVRG